MFNAIRICKVRHIQPAKLEKRLYFRKLPKSLEPSVTIWDRTSQISILTIYFCEFDHSEWFSAKIFSWKILMCHPIWLFLVVMAPRRKLYLLNWDFLDTKFSGIVPGNIIYHFWKFQQNRLTSFWEKFERAPKIQLFVKF